MPSFKPTKIIIHHSATKDSGTVSWGAIRRFHTETNGWSDIGYHAGIEKARDSLECFYGRPVTKPGAHTKGQNRYSLGLCFVGNFDIEPCDRANMITAARRVLIPWINQFSIALNNIRPHSEFADKTCPGTLFDMDLLRHIIEKIMLSPRK